MKNVTKHTGRLVRLFRMESSKNGNPRYQAVFQMDSGHEKAAATTPDSMLAYGIDNYLGQRVRVAIGSHYRRDSIADIEPIGEIDY